MSEVFVAVLRCITVRGRITVNYLVYFAAHNTFRVMTLQFEVECMTSPPQVDVGKFIM